MGVVALAAAFLAWVRRYAFGGLAALAATAAFLCLTVLPLRALRFDGRRKAFWVGFAAAGWGYALYHFRHTSGVLGWCPSLPSGRLLDAIYPHLGVIETQPPPGFIDMHGAPEYRVFHLVGQSILCLLVALLGGGLTALTAHAWLLRQAHIARETTGAVRAFRELLSARPFKPFRIVMSSGQAYEVRHPEMAMLTRRDLLVGVDAADDGVPAGFKICPLLHITAVEPLSPAATGSEPA
jgi:hypothetical protein